MPLLALVATLALGCAPTAEDPRPADRTEIPEIEHPGPRHRVGGLLAFQARSRVRFLEAEDGQKPQVLDLVATYAFPDRARWQLEPPEGDASDRRLLLNYGPQVWALQPRSASSERLTEDDARVVRLMFLLRRAVLTWPAGLEWTGEGDQRRVALAEGLVLEARLGHDGLPLEVWSRIDEGPEAERFSDIAWTAEGQGRRRPTAWTLEAMGRPIWHEEVLDLDTRARHVDAFFVPPDLRPRPATPGPAPIDLLVLRAGAVRRIELPEGTGWEGLREAFSRLREAEAAALGSGGRDLDTTPRVELDERGRPRRFLLVLPRSLAPPPEGWDLVGESSAVGTLLADPGAIGSVELRRLRDARPERTRPDGLARVRLRPRGVPGPSALLLQPLAPGS